MLNIAEHKNFSANKYENASFITLGPELPNLYLIQTTTGIMLSRKEHNHKTYPTRNIDENIKGTGYIRYIFPPFIQNVTSCFPICTPSLFFLLKGANSFLLAVWGEALIALSTIFQVKKHLQQKGIKVYDR